MSVSSMTKAIIETPKGSSPFLVVAPVGSAAMEGRHNGRRKNHRNEGQGKKQVNHRKEVSTQAVAASMASISLRDGR
jgi:hypothetical protein